MFGGLLGILGATLVIGPIIGYFWPSTLEEIPSEPVAVGSPDQVPPGGSITVRFGRYPALVINTPDGLRAYSAVCTHFACLVKWNPDSGMTSALVMPDTSIHPTGPSSPVRRPRG